MKRPNAGRVGHLPTRRKVSIYVTSAGVWLTGCVWLVFHYFIKVEDQYGFDTPHPGEHYSLIAHALFAFVAIWFFGVLWPGHVKKSWKAHIRRWSGGFLFGFTTWLTLTGFLLYYVGSDFWRSTTSLAHWIAGIAGLIPFVWHLVTRRATRHKAH